MAAIQQFFRRESEDEFSGEKTFIYGRSTANQRTEAWWGRFRQGCADWWVEYFKNLRDSDLYNDENVIHRRECLRFCFMDLIQDELNSVALERSLPRIRPITKLESPSGKPDILYFLQELKGVQDYSTPIDVEEIQIAENMCTTRRRAKECCPAFRELAEMIMADDRLDTPSTIVEARQLYFVLLDLFWT